MDFANFVLISDEALYFSMIKISGRNQRYEQYHYAASLKYPVS